MPRMKDAPVDPDDITRYTIKLSNKHQFQLAMLAKTYKISQPEVIAALLDNLDIEKMAPIFASIREDKVAGREEKKDLLKKLSKLDAEQLKALTEQVS